MGVGTSIWAKPSLVHVEKPHMLDAHGGNLIFAATKVLLGCEAGFVLSFYFLINLRKSFIVFIQTHLIQPISTT